jgi:hypothetical protein
VTVLQVHGEPDGPAGGWWGAGRLDWKYCLGLELTDPGFDFSVLSEFRSRLVAEGLEKAPLDLLLARLKELGLAGAGMRQRTDSTHVLAWIRGLNRLELAGEAVRAALEALAAAAPGWPRRRWVLAAGVRAGDPVLSLTTGPTRNRQVRRRVPSLPPPNLSSNNSRTLNGHRRTARRSACDNTGLIQLVAGQPAG